MSATIDSTLPITVKSPQFQQGVGVTVVVPCFNGERHLGATIDSLLVQDEMPDEILVVDDGSEDRTRQVAESYGGIVRVLSQKNGGAASARYTGVINSRHEIVVFVDAGDVATASKVRLYRAALLKYPDCVCAFGVAWNTAHPKPTASKITELPFNESFKVIENPFRWMLAHHWPAAGVMDVAIRRSVAMESLDVPSFFQAANDYAAQIRTALHGSFVHVAAITSEYVFLPKGITSRFGLSLQIGYAVCAAVDAFEVAADPSARAILEKRIASDLARGLVAAYLRKRWKLLRKLFAIQIKYGSARRFPRLLWWALKNAHVNGELTQAGILEAVVRMMLIASHNQRQG